MEVEKIIEEKFTGIDIPEQIKEKIIAVVSDYESTFTKLNSDSEFHRSEMKKAIEKRDEVKNNFRDFKMQVSNGQAPEVQELNKKVLEFESKYDTLEQTLTDYKTKFESADNRLKEINQKQREQLLATFPQGTELRKFAEGLDDLDKLNSFVLVSKTNKVGVDGGKPGGDLQLDTAKAYDDYSSKELDEIKKKYPEAYNQLYRKKYPFTK